MPTLVLVRHAKAEEPQPGLSDHDRALTLVGRKAAASLGERLAEAGIVPDVSLVSSANRAQQTWARMASALDGTRMVTVPELYGAGVGGYRDAIATVRDADVVMTVAHEPTASDVARWLANDESDGSALAAVAMGLVTSGAAVLELESWDDVRPGGGRLLAVYSGKG